MLAMLAAYIHTQFLRRSRRIVSALEGERGQGTVEYVGLILLVSLLMVGMVAAMKGFNGKQGTELADLIVNKIKQAVTRSRSATRFRRTPSAPPPAPPRQRRGAGRGTRLRPPPRSPAAAGEESGRRHAPPPRPWNTPSGHGPRLVQMGARRGARALSASRLDCECPPGRRRPPGRPARG